MRNYIAFVHGIGTQSPTDYDHFERALRSTFDRKVQARTGAPPPPDALVWRTAYWANVTQEDQDALKRRLNVTGRIQTFFVDSAGDAVAYSRVPGGKGKYADIQHTFADTLRSLATAAADNYGPTTKAPLTVIAHSLGTVIATGTIQALHREDAFPGNLELKRLYTMGSPIALYGLRYGLANFTPPFEVPTWINLLY
ncbi:MAG: hypothetical protein FJ313_06400, partial [Gemmatimonadetes bacterium]|nr:hypothetical protein [Gemmatimonadota bacterium]